MATIINSVINALLIMSGVLALFMLVWYGIRAIFYAGTPDKAKEIGTVFVWVMVGIAVLLLAKPILNTVFGGISDADGTVTSSNFLKPFDPDVDDKTKLITKVAEPLAGTVGNIIDFLMMISAVIAVVMIVWYGIRTIFYAASPEEAAKIKTVILWVVLGLIILLIAKPLVGILW
ncbi:MAG: hypothetical protein U9Q15_05040 [Patescibacteria group bacterium]|nr:hypothetical protein [Patescibacteria group bacterium]